MILRSTKPFVIAAIYIAASMLKLFMAVYLPALVLVFAALDDGLFMRLAQSLAAGNWLGGFSEFTLMKGPGYPLFLAASSFTGLPVTITTGALQLCAIAIIAWAVFRLTASHLAAALLFALMALHPIGYMPALTRIIRDQIYWPQTLVVVALFAVLFLAPPRRIWTVLLLACAAGLMLGWAWLTREEGVWFLPGLAILALGWIVSSFRSGVWLGRVFLGVAASLVMFAAVNVSFRIANHAAYGLFVGVDVKERNFVAALDALQSVEVGPRLDKIPVSIAARDEVAKISPTFRPVSAMLVPNGPLDVFRLASCHHYPGNCNELAGGWFIWAFRSAMAQQGHYASPAQASEAYGQIAEDVEAACADGRLTCRRSLLSFMPPLTYEQWMSVPASMLEVVKVVAFIGLPTGLEEPAPFFDENDKSAFYESWDFLNRPVSALPFLPGETDVSGWYYDEASDEWPAFEVRSATNVLVPAVVERFGSDDLVRHFDDPDAARNRMKLSFICPDRCSILAKTRGRSDLRMEAVPYILLRSGAERMYFDTVSTPYVASRSPHARLPLLANRIRLELSRLFHLALPPLLGVGLLAAAAAVVSAARSRTLTPPLVLALAAWALVAARIAILTLIDVSSFPAATFLYAAPAAYLAVLAAVASFAALFAVLGQWRIRPSGVRGEAIASAPR